MNGRFERNPGRVVDLSPGDTQDVLDLQWKDEIAHVICVTLIGPPAFSADQPNAAVCVALVQWGAGEAEAEAEIDFGVGGVVFTLPASSIRITARYEATFVTGESDPVVRIGAFASVGSGARQTRLTRTRIEADKIDPAASAEFDVPPFAKAVRVLAGDQAVRAFTLDFFNDTSAPSPAYSIEVPAGTAAPLTDLAPDITAVVMTNTGAAALAGGARAIFELGI
jgi:hypothetical protein